MALIFWLRNYDEIQVATILEMKAVEFWQQPNGKTSYFFISVMTLRFRQ